MKSVGKFLFLSPLGAIWTVMATSAIALSPVAIAEAQVPLRQIAQSSFVPKVIFVRREVSGPSPNGRYKGGGSRSVDGQEAMCPESQLPLTALVPFEEFHEPGAEELPPTARVWGFTTAERPTVWVYVPYSNSEIPATLSVEDDEAKRTLYNVPVTLPKQAGVMGIRLPDQQPGLEVGKRYRWFFGLDCKSPSSNMTDEIYVEAVIVREQLPAEAARKLTPNPSLENAAIYAEHGFWHDALTTLAELHRQKPEDSTIQDTWQALLAKMPLSEKAKQTFYTKELSTAPIVK